MPKDAFPVVVLSVALMAFVSWNQSYWWLTLEEDHFGWLTPALVFFILYDRRKALLTKWNQCGADGSPRASGLQSILVTLLFGAMFTLGLLLLLAGAADRAGGGHSFKGTFLASFGVCLLLLSIPWFAAPRPRTVSAGGVRNDPRVSLCGLILFPALVWLLSEPLLTQAETQLSSHILAPMAATIAHLFDLLGFPITREGNILLMPDHGRIGVEEACSGIRSFAACLYAGAFLGALMLRRFWQQALLILLATFFAFVLNFFRSLFLTTWAYNHGAASIEGFVHDTAGYLVMGLTIAGLFLILSCLKRTSQKARFHSAL